MAMGLFVMEENTMEHTVFAAVIILVIIASIVFAFWFEHSGKVTDSREQDIKKVENGRNGKKG